MTTVIATQATTIDLSILDAPRNAVADNATKTGELIQCYAKPLCAVFNVLDITGKTIITPWYKLQGKAAKGVKEERAKFVAAMVARGHVKPDGKPSATVDTYWARVKEASGHVPSGKVSGTTDVDAKTASELKTIINRILKSEEDGSECHASTILESLKSAYFVLTGEAHNAGK
jgi:hypothetical protein